MGNDRLLLLNPDDLDRRVAEMFGRMHASPSYREAFVRNPAGALGLALYGDAARISPARVNQANRIIYAILSNPKLSSWLDDLSKRLDSQSREARAGQTAHEASRLALLKVDKPTLYRELSRGIARFGDPELIHSLVIVDDPPGLSKSGDIFDFPHVYKNESVFSEEHEVVQHTSLWLDEVTHIMHWTETYTEIHVPQDSQAHADLPHAAHHAEGTTQTSDADQAHEADGTSQEHEATGIDHGHDAEGSARQINIASDVGTDGLILKYAGLSRVDLEQVARQMAAGLQARADQLRKSGALTSLDATRRGGAL